MSDPRAPAAAPAEVSALRLGGRRMPLALSVSLLVHALLFSLQLGGKVRVPLPAELLRIELPAPMALPPQVATDVAERISEPPRSEVAPALSAAPAAAVAAPVAPVAPVATIPPPPPMAAERSEPAPPVETLALAAPELPPRSALLAVERPQAPLLAPPLEASAPAQAQALVAAALREAERRDVERQEAARREEAARQEAARQEAARQESARLEAVRQEALRQEAARQEAARQETTRQEAANQEAARLAAARQEALRQEAARQDAARQESARQEAARQEAARQEAARLEAASQEAARLAAARQAADEAARAQAAAQAAQDAKAAQLAARAADDARREAARRAMGRQLDEEAAQREAAERNARSATQPGSLPGAWSQLRRARLYGRSDPNEDLVQYAEAWARRIQLNTPPELVRELAARPHQPALVTVALRRDGSVESISFVVGSGQPEVDAGIRRIVEMHRPHPVFPAALARDYDVVEIRRSWVFNTAVWLQ